MTASTPQVRPLRAAAREMIRELGFLTQRSSETGITHAQCHALLELQQSGPLSSGELARRLLVDKSTASRTVGQLLEQKLATVRADPNDLRRKTISLSAAGRRLLKRVHRLADQQVGEALELLPEPQRNAVVAGVRDYAKALRRRRLLRDYEIRPIQRRDDAAMAGIIRAVMTEHGACGAGYSINDPEVDAMFRTYNRPRHGFFVIEHAGRVVGGGGFGPLEGAGRTVCELRKMYLLPETRGLGLGARLVSEILAAARRRGFRTCYLETLESMDRAGRLYESFGFRQLDGPLGNTGHFSCDRWYSRAL